MKENSCLRKILLGLIIWIIPFVISILVWDVEANTPIFSLHWFNALMAFTWGIGFAIAAFLYFSKLKGDPVKGALTAGIVWFVELLILDLIFLVKVFGMPMGDFYPMVLTYFNVIIFNLAIGYILKK